MLDISFNRAIQIVYLKQLVTNFATQCFTPEGDHQANEYSFTISLDGLCDDARHIACANNLNLNYVFARACARLNFCALNFFLWRHFVKSSDLLFNVLSLFDFRIKIFSSKHKSHDLPPAVYAGTRLIIDHLMLNDLPFSPNQSIVAYPHYPPMRNRLRQVLLYMNKHSYAVNTTPS